MTQPTPVPWADLADLGGLLLLATAGPRLLVATLRLAGRATRRLVASAASAARRRRLARLAPPVVPPPLPSGPLDVVAEAERIIQAAGR